MEYQKHLQVAFIFLLLCGSIFAQKELICFKTNGNVKFEENNKKVFVGTVIAPNQTVINESSSKTILVDESSNLYEITSKGKSSYKQIVANKIKNESESVSSRYLSYFFKKFLNKEEQKTEYGGVFRGNDLKELPNNYDYFIEQTEIFFSWKNVGPRTYYLWIMNTENDAIVGKFTVDANNLTCLLPLEKGVYKWTVTTNDEIENEQNFNFFEIVAEEEFLKRKEDSLYEAKTKADLILEKN